MTAAAGVLTAGPALAQENYPPYPPNGESGGVSGIGGGSGGDLAFTGADLAMWMLLGLALLALGVATLWTRRRRLAGQT